MPVYLADYVQEYQVHGALLVVVAVTEVELNQLTRLLFRLAQVLLYYVRQCFLEVGVFEVDQLKWQMVVVLVHAPNRQLLKLQHKLATRQSTQQTTRKVVL